MKDETLSENYNKLTLNINLIVFCSNKRGATAVKEVEQKLEGFVVDSSLDSTIGQMATPAGRRREGAFGEARERITYYCYYMGVISLFVLHWSQGLSTGGSACQ